jgi:hypothetical protein
MMVEYETFKKDMYLVSHNIVTYKSTITLNTIKHSESTINMEYHSSTRIKCMNIQYKICTIILLVIKSLISIIVMH